MTKILIVANVAREHICKFHLTSIRLLKEKGWQVDVACVHDADVPYCDRQFDLNYKRNTLSLATIRGTWQLRRIIRQERYDVIHCHTPTGGTAGRLAVLFLKEKPFVIYTAHGFHFFKGAPLISWLVFYPVEWLLSHWTDCLITINSEDYHHALKYRLRMKKLAMIPSNGIDPAHYRRQADPDLLAALKNQLTVAEEKLIITYVAELNHNKNQLVLLKMIRLIREQSGIGHLILVGPDNYQGKYQKLAIAMGVAAHVTFAGWRNDVQDLLSITDVYVASSIREGLGLNVIEAMCCDVPVVASDNRGHREIIQDGLNGYLVHYTDAHAFARRVLQCCEPGNRSKIITAARAMIGRFDRAVILSNMHSFYESVAVP